MNFDYETDLTIVGCGPAGLTAAIYACRANLNVIMIDKNSPGGKVITTASVENYPGFNEISGPDLSLKFFEQAQNLGAKFIFNDVLDIQTDVNENFKFVKLKNEKIDILVTVGDEASYINEGAIEAGYNKENSYHFKDNKTAIEFINTIKKQEDNILVKASNSMNFKEIVDSIK